jgi:hypothetical protein
MRTMSRLVAKRNSSLYATMGVEEDDGLPLSIKDAVSPIASISVCSLGCTEPVTEAFDGNNGSSRSIPPVSTTTGHILRHITARIGMENHETAGRQEEMQSKAGEKLEQNNDAHGEQDPFSLLETLRPPPRGCAAIHARWHTTVG